MSSVRLKKVNSVKMNKKTAKNASIFKKSHKIDKISTILVYFGKICAILYVGKKGTALLKTLSKIKNINFGGI